MRRTPIVAFVVVLLTSAGARAQLPPWCGGALGPGETAMLGVDMECGLIRLGRDATLDLNGHTFTGIVMGPERGTARFTVRGPGAIEAQFPDNPCVAFAKGKVLIDGGTGQVTLRNAGFGVLAATSGTTVTLRHVTMKRTVQRPMSLGVQAAKVDATDVTIDFRDTLDVQKGHGIQATRKIAGSGIVLRHTARGLTAKSIVVSDVVADDTDAAIAGPRTADVTRLTSTRHGAGVYARRLRLTDSTLSDARSGGVDVATALPPLLVGTMCETSARWDPLGPGLAFGGTWGVCTND